MDGLRFRRTFLSYKFQHKDSGQSRLGLAAGFYLFPFPGYKSIAWFYQKRMGCLFFIVARNGTSLYLFLPFFDFFKGKKQLRRNLYGVRRDRCLDHTPPERKAVRSRCPIRF